jgi:hypothetical protein
MGGMVRRARGRRVYRDIALETQSGEEYFLRSARCVYRNVPVSGAT